MEKAEAEKKPQIKISVRNLVEFILRSGDIDQRQGSMDSVEAMQAGSRLHRKIQRRQASSYHAEVPLVLVIEEEYYQLVVEGRADGIILEEQVTIDEIKGIYMNLELLEEPVPVHLAQAKCYAYIYGIQHDLSSIDVQMTYGNLDTEELRYFRYSYSMEELQQWFSELILKYKKWADFQYEWRQIRQQSIKPLPFPFPYREGQKDLVSDVYRSIARKKTLFIQAPTGVGKTISTIYPAVKAVGEELADKIFYLTAKTITANVAKETLELLGEQGYRGKSVQITAKEKMCLCEEVECTPEKCPYAKGHYDRVNDAVFELLHKADVMNREVLLQQAKEWTVCPFEMCLDTSTWADNIICDYNYVFDPNVYLKRFFQEGIKGDYIFLVDEAHNLVERGRQMYSAAVVKEDFLAMKKIFKLRSTSIVKELDKCNKKLLEYKRQCDTYEILDDISTLIFAFMNLASKLNEYLQKNPEFPDREEVVDFYFSLRDFLNIYDCVDEHYVIYTQHTEDGSFVLKLFCVDPSRQLQERIDRANATVFFSATLLPIQYYKKLLSTRIDNYAIYAKTMFSPEQRNLLLASDVSSKYTRRGPEEYERIADYIAETVQAKTGNYMVFFPSYLFLNEVYEIYEKKYPGSARLLRQESGMREEKREEFLRVFEEESEESLVAFCVMGGIFGEGIDLKEEKLIGALIVGTGLPQIGTEREILKNYYDENGENGFDYAYRFPGMNKVLQAAGRVIRTVEDVGVIELLDERFLQREYKMLFPREWEQHEICNVKNLPGKLQDFWERKG